MGLYVFSTVVLSFISMLVFGAWWSSSAPFKIHLASLAVAMTVILSCILIITIYPILIARTSSSLKKRSSDIVTWGSEISGNLTTPAAVLDGYNLTFVNKAFLVELGMSGMSDQIVGMPLTNLVHPSNHLDLAKFIARTAQDHQYNETIKLRILHSDGTTLSAQMSLSPLLENGNSGLNLLQFSSSSSQRAAVTQLHAQSDYHLLINQIEQIVFQVNVNNEIIFLNHSWEDLLDHPIKDSLNKPLTSFIHPEDKPMVESSINSLAHGKGSGCHLETRLITKDGGFFWVELRAKPTSSLKGERSSVIGTLTDISRMKSMDATLRANRRSLSTLLSNIPGMVYRCKNDRNWSFEFASDSCFDVTGYEPYEMINSPIFSYTNIIHPDDQVRTWEYVQQQVSRQQKFQMIYRIITRSGNVKWVWEQGKGVFSSTGELLALEGFITDIADDVDHDMLINLQALFSQLDLS